MKRRQFIAGLGSAAALPLAARAQQSGRVRRIGVLMGGNESDPERRGWLFGFTQGLSELGWTDGGNLRIEVRWFGDNVEPMRMFAKELAGVQPDVMTNKGAPECTPIFS
jgi:putative tryptophan/tyrosine transport system substrate-binding protein